MNFKKVFLRNFKNYEKESLDLESSSFWILRGKNSSGKSTLACDALTYALFGKIKAMDDPQDTKVGIDDVIKRGKSKTTVRVEFTNKGDNFVVERIREIKKKASKETVLIKKNGKIIHPKDAPKTKGDKWIGENLWTYKDFTNTTLIMQDEMTKALNLRTGDRKDYLERLFGIKDFHDMSVLSREKGKEILGDLATEDARIKEKQKNLVDDAELKTRKLELEKNLLTLKQYETEIKSNRTNKNKKLAQLKATSIELNGIKDDIINNEKKLTEFEINVQEKEIQIKKISDKLEEKSQLKEKLVKIELLEKQIEDIKIIKDRVSSLEKLKTSILQQINDKEISLKNEIINNSDKIEKSENEKIEYKAELENLKAMESEIPRIKKILMNEKKLLSKLEDLKSLNSTKSELTMKLEKKRNERDIKIQNSQEQITFKQNEVDKLKEHQLDYNQRKKAKSELETQETYLKSLYSDITIRKAASVSKNTTLQVIKNSILTKSKLFNELENKIKDIANIHDHASCPTCKQSLTNDHVNEILIDLNRKKETIQKEKTSSLNTTLTLEAEIKLEDSNLSTLTDEEEETQQLINQSRRTSDGIEASLTRLNKVKEIQQELQKFSEKGGLTALFPKIKADISMLKDQISGITVDDKKILELESEKNELIKKREMLRNLTDQITKIPSLEIKIEKIADSLLKTREKIDNLEIILAERSHSKQLRDEYHTIKDEIDQLKSNLVAEKSLMAMLIDLNPQNVRDKLSEIVEAEKSKAGMVGELKGLRSQMSGLKQENSLKLAKIDDTKYLNIEIRVSETNDDLMNLEEQYVNAIEEKQEAETRLDHHSQVILTQEKLTKEISRYELKIKDKREDHDTYKHLEKIFQQIGGRILSRLRYQINVATIDILSLLGNPQLEGITLNSDYSIIIQTPNGEERPSFFSGGQKVRIGFAFRLALSKVLAEFRGNELDTLIIDEGGFGALDEDGQEGVIEVFRSLQDRFERVIVISHIPKITENLPGSQIRIEKGKIADRIN